MMWYVPEGRLLIGTVTVLPEDAHSFLQPPLDLKIFVWASVDTSWAQILTLPLSFLQVDVTIRLVPAAVSSFITELIASVPIAQAADGRDISAAAAIAIVVRFLISALQVTNKFVCSGDRSLPRVIWFNLSDQIFCLDKIVLNDSRLHWS